MPTLNIEGVGRVTVDDSFLKKSPYEQQSIADDIARQANAAKAKGVADEMQQADYGESAKGIAKQFGLGAIEGLETVAPIGAMSGGPAAMQAVGRIVQGLNQRSGAFTEPANTGQEFSRTAGQFVGNPTSYVGGGGAGIKVLQALTSAFGSEGLQQLVKGQGPVAEGVASIVGAVLGGKAPSAAARVRTPLLVEDAQHAARVAELRQFGVEPRAGDVTGSKVLRRAEETLGSLPGAGGAGQREETRIGQQLTDAVVREMGGTESTKDTDISEILSNNRERLQNSFEDVAKKLPITRDKKFGDDIGAVFEDAFKEGLPTETYNRISNQIKNVLRGFDPTKTGKDVMKGSTYQSLTRKNTPLDRDINSTDPNLSYYATRIRSALDDAMERTATGQGTRQGVGRRAALDELRNTRRQWYTMLVLSKAVASSGEKPAHGIITPARLRALIANTDDNKVQYALQRSNMSRLSRSANAVLNPLPNSNTAERLMTAAGIGGAVSAVGSTLGGAPAAIPAWAAGAFGPGLTGRALLSSSVQSYLKNQKVGRLPASALKSAGVAAENQTRNAPAAPLPTLSSLLGVKSAAAGSKFDADNIINYVLALNKAGFSDRAIAERIGAKNSASIKRIIEKANEAGIVGED